jgi:hypothetical protein
MICIIHRINTISDLKKIPIKYGVEIDVREHNDKLILNHEAFCDGEELEKYLKEYRHRFIIFNIKEAGIEKRVIELAKKYSISDYFLLDVEFPFLFSASRNGFKKIAVRYSEAEPIEAALAQKGFVDWVWVDTISKLPLDKKSYAALKAAGFKLCLVCPERWGRPEDIEKYVDFLEKNNMLLDAVMTGKDYVKKWV